jgi:hypothetical protein
LVADTFGVNVHLAAQMARELAEIRADMKDMGKVFDGADGSTGSHQVESALHDFIADSSDNRKKMDGLLERAAGMLAALAEGTTEVDRSLTDALTEPAPGAAQGAQA